MITEHPLLSALQERYPGSLEVVPSVDQPTVKSPKEMLVALMRHLREEMGFSLLLDVSAVDWFPARPRFEVVYHAYNPKTYQRLRVKTWTGVGEPVPSVTAIWPGADWPERETYDLFGITFEDHPNLRRIYMPDDWEGHPLRKDYPVAGPRVD